MDIGVSSTGRHLRLATVAVWVGLACVGCGPAEKKPDAASQATISGKVTLDGTKPAPLDTSVVFYCAEKAATCAGKIDATGSYSIRQADKGIGIPAGRYQIMVRPPEAAPVAMGTDDYNKMMMSGGAAKKATAKSDIPAKFMALDTTPLILEIQPGPNTKDLDLSKF